MRKLTRISLILLVGFFAFLVLPIPQASAAYTYTDIAWTGVSGGYAALSYTVLTTGVLAKAQVNHTSLDVYSKVHVYFISASGSQLADVQVTVGDGSNKKYPREATIIQLDENELLLSTVLSSAAAESSWYNAYIYFTRINFVTYTASSNYALILESLSSGSSETVEMAMSKLFKYSNDYFCMIHFLYKGTNLNSEKICMVAFDPDTNTVTNYDEEQIDTSTSVANWDQNLVAFQDPDNDRYFYTILAKNDNPTTPTYWKCDADSHTLEIICTHPNPLRWNSTRRLQLLGGSTYVDGDDIYLYFTWAFPGINAEVNYYDIIQHRMRFNETTIDADNLQEQNERIETIVTDSTTREEWIWGYEESKDSYVYYHPYDHMTLGEIVLKRRITITDWTDFGTNDWDTIESLEEAAGIFPYADDNDIIARDPGQTFQTNEGSLRVYYGLEALDTDYDLTLSYAPADIPLLDSKSYVFTATGTQNLVGFKHVQKLYVDSTGTATQTTSASGVAAFSASFNAGIHNITIEMYSTTGTYLHVESWLYAVAEDSTPDGTTYPGMIPGIVQLIAQGLPAMVVIMLPIMGLSRIKDVPPIVSVMSGMTIGVVVATMGGMIPVYLTFMYVLCLAIIIVYMMRK